MKEHGQITNSGYQKLGGISRRTALRDLQELLEKQIVKRIGTVGSDVVYILK
jgi:Fic family protein